MSRKQEPPARGMSALSGIESSFQAYVLAGDRTIAGEIVGDTQHFREQRLAIYYDAYRLRLAEVLANDYEVLKSFAGEERFDAIARDYLAAHPSASRNVRWFGAKLAEFLTDDARYANQPVLAELAQFEWALGLAFDAADAPTVRFEQVATVAPDVWPELRFIPHPALQVLTLRANAAAIWNEIKQSGHGIAAENPAEPIRWAIWRKEYSPFFRSLAADEAWALEAMRTGATFGEICAGLCEWVAEEGAAARAAGLLRAWVDEGWIAGLKIPQ